MDIEKMKALALAATVPVDRAKPSKWISAQTNFGCAMREVSPATVLELIAEVERLRADADRYRLMRAQLSSGDLDYYRLEGEPQNEIDAYCDGEIEAHTKAGKEEACGS